MRGLPLRGFCISVGVYAVVGEPVDLPEGFYREMQRLGALSEPIDEPAAPEVPAADPAEAPPAGTKKRKHA